MSDIRFKSKDGSETLFETGSGAVAVKLVERTPQVKAIKVDVPASDGSLDLTEAVSGRPLYGNRSIDVTIALMPTSHAESVESVRAIRRALHGVVCRVETPDNVVDMDGTPVQGWYLGRVSMGDVEYPNEAALVPLSIDAAPWIRYGTETVLLVTDPEQYVSYDLSQPLPSGTDLSDLVIEVQEPHYGYYTERLVQGGAANRVMLAAMDSANLGILYETFWMRLWRYVDGEWTEVYDPSAYADGTIGFVPEAGRYRVMACAYVEAAHAWQGINVTDMLSGLDSDPDQTVATLCVSGDAGAEFTALAQLESGRAPQEPLPGGEFPSGAGTLYSTTMQVAEAGTVYSAPITWADLGGSTGNGGWSVGRIVAGIEIDIAAATGNEWMVGLIVGDATPTSATWGGYPRATGETAIAELGGNLYTTGYYTSMTGTMNRAEFTPEGNALIAKLRQTGTSRASLVANDPPRIHPFANVDMPDVGGRYLRAFGAGERGYKLMDTTAEFFAWSEDTIDFGDMPAKVEVSADADSPIAIEIDGGETVYRGAGLLQQASGEMLVRYRNLSRSSNSLAFEKGTV